MVERSLSMREVKGSMPCISILLVVGLSSVEERPFRIREVEGSIWLGGRQEPL